MRQTTTDYCEDLLRSSEEIMLKNAAEVKNLRASLRQNARKPV